jgi:23S rRNA pseudouridine2457 synthase
MAKLVLLNKPFNVLSQFRDDNGRPTLAQYINVPDVYPAGRLDNDSEGLLLLTDHGGLQHRISHPDKKLAKTYWAQVEGIPSSESMSALEKGVTLNDGLTKPAKARLIEEPEQLWERIPPIRERAKIPTQWIELTITEGRNRQVRRMTAAVGHPTLRLIRAQIGEWTLGNLLPGESKIIEVEAPPSSPQQHKHPARNGQRRRSTARNRAPKRTSR